MKRQFDIGRMVRENIKDLSPYSSARDEFKGTAEIFLDANESAFGSPLEEDFSRYPDPLQNDLKKRVSRLKNVPSDRIFLGNGSDEAIDLLFRIFCRPGADNVIVCPPTYGMYEVSARVNDVRVKKVSLRPGSFQLDTPAIAAAIDEDTKIIFICDPNNPTGNRMERADMKDLLEIFPGLVVVDEAYVDFAGNSILKELDQYPNLLVLQTFSKAWGMAGLRLGMAFGSAEIIAYFNKIKAPYNISSVTQQLVVKALQKEDAVGRDILSIVSERENLRVALNKLSFVIRVYQSDANFLLVKMEDAGKIYRWLADKGIVVRDRSKVEHCEGCLRITVGTPDENKELVDQLRTYADGIRTTQKLF